jgi:uroporphyrinogen III methyltransferase/synthase
VTVYLVGAGPGDPGLLTVRGAQLLAEADAVVYDGRVDSQLLAVAPVRAERIDVTGQTERPPMTQGDVSRLLVELGRVHHVVVRLAPGDPYVFSSGGEEAASLRDAGVAFEVVPGVIAAVAVPAYAGVSLTTPQITSSLTVVSAAEASDPPVDWDAIVGTGGTLVLLGDATNLPPIVERLSAAGLSGETPVVSVQRGTWPDQAAVRITLAGLAREAPDTPSVIVIGDSAASDLRWFEHRPLFGYKVAVTRSRAQASSLSSQLRELGAEVVEVPTIAIAEPSDGGAALHAAARRIGDYDWLVVTSPNGARRTMGALVDARALGGVKVAAIGPATAQALAESKLVADLVPSEYVAESLLAALGTPPAAGGRILLSRAAVARDVLPDGLAAAGWDVDVVEAYRTVRPEPTDRQRRELADAGVVTFTSSSTAANFVAAFGVESVPPIVACIGPVTAATARDLGLTVDVEASVHTIDGLVDALLEFSAR